MTGTEAIPKLTALLAALIERVKDRQTAALVQQIQEFHQQVISDYHKIQAENAELKTQLSQAHTNPLVRKYGILWDNAGTPYCPRCQKSGMRIVWQSHLNRQVKAFRMYMFRLLVRPVGRRATYSSR